MRLMPPSTTKPTANIAIKPVPHNGTANTLAKASAMLLTCTRLPIPKLAKPPNKAKAAPNQAQR